MSTDYKTVQYYEATSDFSEVKIVNLPKPEFVRGGYVLVKIHAAAINPIDLLVRTYLFYHLNLRYN
jgi:NADPH:quinone reductase-like Zn-dependent oxidoreductase